MKLFVHWTTVRAVAALAVLKSIRYRELNRLAQTANIARSNEEDLNSALPPKITDRPATSELAATQSRLIRSRSVDRKRDSIAFFCIGCRPNRCFERSFLSRVATFNLPVEINAHPSTGNVVEPRGNLVHRGCRSPQLLEGNEVVFGPLPAFVEIEGIHRFSEPLTVER